MIDLGFSIFGFIVYVESFRLVDGELVAFMGGGG